MSLLGGWQRLIPAFTCRDFENRRKASIRIRFVTTEVQTEDSVNTNQYCYCSSQLARCLLVGHPVTCSFFCDRGYRYARVMTAPPFTIVCRQFNLHLLVLLLMVALQDTSCQTTQIGTSMSERTPTTLDRQRSEVTVKFQSMDCYWHCISFEGGVTGT